MRRIQIPGVRKTLTQLGMGTGADMYHPDHMDYVTALSDAYVELGGNVFDTAHQYVGSEEALGKWLELRGLRDSVVIMTKGAHPDDGSPGPRVSARHIKEDMMESLERLRVKHVEMYALHRDDESVPVGEIMETLHEAVVRGYVEAIGASNWTQRRVEEANRYAAEHNLTPFTFTSTNFSLAKPLEPRWPGCVSADESYMGWHRENRVPLLSWSSLAGGFFSGRFTPDYRENEEMVRVYYCEDNWKRVDRARELARRKGVDTVQIALAYVLNQPIPIVALVAPDNIAEMRSNFAAAEIELSPEELDWLDLKSGALPEGHAS